VTVVEDYQEQTEALAASTVAAVLALYAAVQAGGVAPAALAPAIAAVVATANATATTLADLAVSAQIERATGVPTPPTGITPRDDTERLNKALETILDDLPEPDDEPDPPDEDDLADDDVAEPDDLPEPDDEPDPPDEDDEPDEPEPDEEIHADEDEPDPVETAATRLERLARSEPLDTAQAVTVEIINRLPVVTGWMRKLDADPCARCQRWAENGRVFPQGHHFKRHYGCNCAAEIVTTTTEGTAS
jgi:hypothetical protein